MKILSPKINFLIEDKQGLLTQSCYKWLLSTLCILETEKCFRGSLELVRCPTSKVIDRKSLGTYLLFYLLSSVISSSEVFFNEKILK